MTKEGNKCRSCQGAGEIPWNDGTQPRGFYSPVKCRKCNGTGKTIKPKKP